MLKTAKQLPKPSLILSNQNYYSLDSDWSYMSKSLFTNFIQCEGATIAKLKGFYSPPKGVALIVGNYVHSHFESDEAHNQFIEENKWDIFKSKKATKKQEADGNFETVEVGGEEKKLVITEEMYSEFDTAKACIDKLENQRRFKQMYVGEKEYPVTGVIGDTWWKGKLDLLNIEEGYFIDIKTSADIHKHMWSDKYKKRTNWAFEYGYALQMAIYQELLKQTFNKEFKPIIWAVSKEKHPDVVEIEFAQDDLDFETYWLSQKLPRIKQVMTGEIAPYYCGKCDYCKEHKQINGSIDANEL